MRRCIYLALFLSLGGLALGCGDSDSVPPATPESACTTAAASYCAKIKECAPFYFDVGWSTQPPCDERIKSGCVSDLGAPGNAQTADDLASCATAIPQTSCGDLFSDNLPAPCKPKPGSLANGNACGVDGQCQSTYCKINETCGVCAAKSSAGGACMSETDCTDGLLCVNRVCTSPGVAGAACSATQPCRQDVTCIGGTCGTPKGPGESCTGEECDGLKGLWCNPLMGVCQKVSLADPGQPCGALNCPGAACTYALCRSGGLCRLSGTNPNAGTCVAPAADGAACNDTMGPPCLSPAVCVAEVCTLRAPATCR
jgi:hypothetical protein